jgi:hypothetical protein
VLVIVPIVSPFALILCASATCSAVIALAVQSACHERRLPLHGFSAREAADLAGHAKVSMTQDVYFQRGGVHAKMAGVLGLAPVPTGPSGQAV